MRLSLLRAALGLIALALLSSPALGQAAPEASKVIRPGGNEEEWAAKRNFTGIAFAGAEGRGFANRGFGVRPFVADGTAGTGQSTAGIVARERGTGLLLERWISARYADDIWLGYDGVDFSARALLDMSVGFRLPVTRYTGPVARLALFAEVTQLSGWFKTELRPGAGEFGWTYARGAGHLDLVLQVGPTVLGQVDLGSTHRTLGGLTWGAYLSSGWENLTFDFRINQIGQDAAAGPVTDLHAEACGLLFGRPLRPTRSTRGKAARTFSGPKSREFRALLCTDLSYGQASGDSAAVIPGVAAAPPSRWSTVGISIFFGRSTRLDPLPRAGL